MNSEFFRFVLVGGVAAGANISSPWLLSSIVPFETAVFFAYLVGMIVAFILTRKYVFKKSTHRVSTEATRFVLVNLLALVQVWLISVGLANWICPMVGLIWQAELIAHILGVCHDRQVVQRSKLSLTLPHGLNPVCKFVLAAGSRQAFRHGPFGRKTTKCDMEKFAAKPTRMETSFATKTSTKYERATSVVVAENTPRIPEATNFR